jgi:alanine-glyoxylate transaminase / serine-glyoxylate transaminase / serine-pyruvate transaminase
MRVSIPPPVIPELSEVLPADPRLLMGAGPVPIPAAVARANGVVINHLGDTMDRVIGNVKQMAAYVFQTRSATMLGLAGPSSGAMEMAVSNVGWPGRRVLCLTSGTFGTRMGDMAAGVGADVVMLAGEEAKPVTVAQVRDALAGQRFDVVTMTHGETSCGVRTIELREICALAKAHGALTIVDAVVTLGAMPVCMDEWRIDVCFTGGQKALSSIPGVSLCAFSADAWKAVEAHPTPRPHWCYDAIRAQRFWGHQQYHYTAPTPGILALHEALRLVVEETLERRFERHAAFSRALQEGLEAMGLQLFVSRDVRLDSVIAIRLPPGVDSARVRDRMANAFFVEISGAFGLPIVRIGQMGEQCRPHCLRRTLSALGDSLAYEGATVDLKKGMFTLERALDAITTSA